MTNSIGDLMRDKIKRLEQENSTLRQQLAAATERLAQSERCVEFFFGCQVVVDIPPVTYFDKTPSGAYCVSRWTGRIGEHSVATELERVTKGSALDAYLAAVAANWLQPAERGGRP